MTKAELRREMRTRLATVGPVREAKSKVIVESIAQNSKFAASRRIALFSPMPTEPDIDGLWGNTKHQFCYPRIVDGNIEFVDVRNLHDLTASDWHPQIREHGVAEAHVIPPVEIEVILVPGLAFTSHGERLGRGGGFYDRYLAQLRPATFKMGVCFATQVVKSLPTEPHDQRMNMIATEFGLLRC